MTIYLTRLMSAISERTIGKYWLSYFRENYRGEINSELLEAFKSSGLTKADIARKLNKRPEQITRWLSAPSNIESDTISDIALSLGYIPKIRLERIGDSPSNSRTHEFVSKIERSSAHSITYPTVATSTQVKEISIASQIS